MSVTLNNDIAGAAASGGELPANNSYLTAPNAAGDGVINLIKATAADRVQIGDATTSRIYMGAPDDNGSYVQVQAAGAVRINTAASGSMLGTSTEIDTETIYLFGTGIGDGSDSCNVHFYDADATNRANVKAPANISADYSMILPTAGPSANSALTSDNTGQLSFTSGASGTFTTADAKTVTVSRGIITSIV
jgi:hypothetical protein